MFMQADYMFALQFIYMPLTVKDESNVYIGVKIIVISIQINSEVLELK